MGQDNKESKLQRILNRERPPYYVLVGLPIIEVFDNSAKLKLEYSERILNPYGFVNGGIIATLADAAVANALLTAYDDEILATIEFNLNLLKAAKTTLYGEGHLIHKGNRIAVAEALIKDDNGSLIAKGSFTYAVSRLKGDRKLKG